MEDAAEAVALSTFITAECPHLRLVGLMTVGEAH